MAAKWFVDALEKADSKAKTVLGPQNAEKDDLLDSNGHNTSDGTAQAQVTQEAVKQRKLEQLIAQLKAKDAIIAQLQEDHNQLMATKAAEERKFQELLHGLEKSKESLRVRLEEEQRQLHEQLSQAGGLHEYHEYTQRELERAHEETREATAACQRKEEQLQALQMEFADYKSRASKLLQEKDRSLQEMKLRSPSSSANMVSREAFESMESERDMAQAELRKVQQELDKMQQEQQVLVEQMVRMEAERKSLEQKHQAAIRQGEEAMQQLQSEHHVLRHEYEQEMENNMVERRQLMTAIKEKDSLTMSLEKRIQQLEGEKQNSELEARLQSLGDRLIEKQKELEKSHWEKETLARQLEVARERLQAAETKPVEARLDIENTYQTGDTWDHGHRFYSALSRKGVWGSRLATASKAIDHVGLSAGRLLRRSSLLRLLMMLYIVLLHFWVMIVLSSSALPSVKPDSGPS